MSSATGGYILPTTPALPGGLTLDQFIQQAFVGMTGLNGKVVRPKWQVNMPKDKPLTSDNWLAFGISETLPDANAYTEQKQDGTGQTLQRHQGLSVLCSFYGPAALNNAQILRDAFQAPQNRDVLKTGFIDFTGCGSAIKVPEVHGGVWFMRVDMTVFLTQQINRDYTVLDFASSSGTIKGLKDNNELENVPFNVEEIE